MFLPGIVLNLYFDQSVNQFNGSYPGHGVASSHPSNGNPGVPPPSLHSSHSKEFFLTRSNELLQHWNLWTSQRSSSFGVILYENNPVSRLTSAKLVTYPYSRSYYSQKVLVTRLDSVSQSTSFVWLQGISEELHDSRRALVTKGIDSFLQASSHCSCLPAIGETESSSASVIRIFVLLHKYCRCQAKSPKLGFWHDPLLLCTSD